MHAGAAKQDPALCMDREMEALWGWEVMAAGWLQSQEHAQGTHSLD